MRQEPISEMSTEKLKKNYKVMKLAIGILSGMFIIMAVSGLYITLTKGFGTISILPLVFLPLFVNNIIQLKKIKTELLTRDKIG